MSIAGCPEQAFQLNAFHPATLTERCLTSEHVNRGVVLRKALYLNSAFHPAIHDGGCSQKQLPGQWHCVSLPLISNGGWQRVLKVTFHCLNGFLWTNLLVWLVNSFGWGSVASYALVSECIYTKPEHSIKLLPIRHEAAYQLLGAAAVTRPRAPAMMDAK